MTHNIQLTDQQLKVISECLMLGAYGLVRPIVDCINAQLLAELEAPDETEGFTRTEYPEEAK